MPVCVLIPTYNTGSLLRSTVLDVLSVHADVIVIVDGSDDGSDHVLRELEEADIYPKLRVLRRPVNGGKGRAIYDGAQLALQEGYTHALAFDSDGQHPAEDIRGYVAESSSSPQAMILGDPVYDESVPRVRYNGHKIANFWTDVVTLWAGVGDCLFGMRLYPLKDLVAVMDGTLWAKGYDFDPEVVIRLAWRGVPIVNLPTPVRYLDSDEGGVSHFHYWRDNVILTWMYFRLLIGGILRSPMLIWQKFGGAATRVVTET